MASKDAWKSLERRWSKMLNKYKVPAKRKSRAGNYCESTDDVGIEGHPSIKSDAKYSIRGFKTNRLWEVMRDKYCVAPEDMAILLTAGYKERGMRATVDGEFMAMLLSHWLGFGSKEDLMNIYLKGPKDESNDME